MNIFYLDSDPIKAAEYMVDKHVVKMIVETAQLLSTAHRVLDGKLIEGNKKVWVLPDDRENVLYKTTHVNHPSAIWCRESNNNYNWLYCHFLALLGEYTHRYGKIHKCTELSLWLRDPPHNIPISWKTQATPAMPDEFKVPGDSVKSYRNYYRVGKASLHRWTKRDVPSWINQ